MTEAPQSRQSGPMTALDEGSGGLYRFLGCTADQYMTSRRDQRNARGHHA